MSALGRLIFVRHGQTHANVDRLWHGSTDTPLTEFGLAQARQLGGYFHNVMKPDVVFASPLQRARNTAEAIASKHNLQVNLDSRLQELCLGEWEGLHFDDINSSHDKDGRIYRDPDFAPPGGESQRMVRDRMVAAIEEVLSTHRGRNIVVVSHGVALGIALSHFLHSDTTKWLQYNHLNTAFSELCLRERKLIYFNRTDHYDWRDSA